MALRPSLLALLALAGCAQAGTAPAAPSAALPGPYLSAAAAGQQPGYRDAVAMAAGLPPLSGAALPPGARELRLWPASGPVAPSLLVRVLDGGTSASAEWVAYWRVSPATTAGDSAVYRQLHEHVREKLGCGPIRREGNVETCLLARSTGPEAAAMVARLDSMGAWALVEPAPREPPAPGGATYVQLDGRGLEVETRHGGGYRHLRLQQRHLDADSAAAALYRFATRGGG